tara:strand:+ start:503 stop:889 length:387 start_codon:yes stop_codon:yes gene_type:complete
MAEIEHFVNPAEKDHHNFHTVADKELIMFGRVDQLGSGKTTTTSIGNAVKTGLVANETLGYFMARTQLFAEKVSERTSGNGEAERSGARKAAAKKMCCVVARFAHGCGSLRSQAEMATATHIHKAKLS